MPLDAKQLAIRHKGIGASEIGAVMGVDPFKSPIDIWLRKTGRAPEYSGNEKTRAGDYLENPILAMFADETDTLVLHPRDVFRDSIEGTVRHPDYPHLTATPDGIVIPKAMESTGTAYRLAQIAMKEGHCTDAKNISLFARSDWEGDRIPPSYHLQVMQQMDVTGLRTHGYLAVLSGGQHFFYREVEYDEEIADMIRDAATRFWFDYVLTDVIPPIDASEGWAKYLARRLPSKLGDLVPADDHAEVYIRQIIQANKDLEEAKERKDLARNRLMAQVGDARGMYGNRWKAAWTEPRKSVAWSEVAKELKAPEDIIKKHTTKGDRVFKVKCEGEDDE